MIRSSKWATDFVLPWLYWSRILGSSTNTQYRVRENVLPLPQQLDGSIVWQGWFSTQVIVFQEIVGFPNISSHWFWTNFCEISKNVLNCAKSVFLGGTQTLLVVLSEMYRTFRSLWHEYSPDCKIPSVWLHLFPESTFDSESVFVLVVVCRLVGVTSSHPRPSFVELLVYRGCPCRDPPVRHRVQVPGREDALEPNAIGDQIDSLRHQNSHICSDFATSRSSSSWFFLRHGLRRVRWAEYCCIFFKHGKQITKMRRFCVCSTVIHFEQSMIISINMLLRFWCWCFSFGHCRATSVSVLIGFGQSNTSITNSPEFMSGNTTHKPASKETTCDSVELWDTDICSLHIQLTWTNVRLPKIHKMPPKVDLVFNVASKEASVTGWCPFYDCTSVFLCGPKIVGSTNSCQMLVVRTIWKANFWQKLPRVPDLPHWNDGSQDIVLRPHTHVQLSGFPSRNIVPHICSHYLTYHKAKRSCSRGLSLRTI